jgi:hypothetical protein
VPRLLSSSGAVAVALASVAISVGLGACGSPSRSALLGTQRQQDCTAIGDVLSDGPDPSADPVGYAEAQVIPLRQLKIADPALSRLVDALAAAYERYASSTPGTAGADARSVAAAEKAVNSVCPGAAP